MEKWKILARPIWLKDRALTYKPGGQGSIRGQGTCQVGLQA